MMANKSLYSQYQHALGLSQRMLQLARQGEWNSLVEMEVTYLNAVEMLSEQQQASQLPLILQEQLRPVLRQLIDNETELRQLLQVRLGELRHLVDQNSLQQTVNHTYGKLAGSIMFPGQPT
ncbi:flagella biosynthesis regulatory protein FliT [Enterobacterales bacterium CwR94]|nr:flagella biosynthesis regulatory protein FliT [Enterobacterales bacterium CwR94]